MDMDVFLDMAPSGTVDMLDMDTTDMLVSDTSMVKTN